MRQLILATTWVEKGNCGNNRPSEKSEVHHIAHNVLLCIHPHTLRNILIHEESNRSPDIYKPISIYIQIVGTPGAGTGGNTFHQGFRIGFPISRQWNGFGSTTPTFPTFRTHGACFPGMGCIITSLTNTQSTIGSAQKGSHCVSWTRSTSGRPLNSSIGKCIAGNAFLLSRTILKTSEGT